MMNQSGAGSFELPAGAIQKPSWLALLRVVGDAFFDSGSNKSLRSNKPHPEKHSSDDDEDVVEAIGASLVAPEHQMGNNNNTSTTTSTPGAAIARDIESLQRK